MKNAVRSTIPIAAVVAVVLGIALPVPHHLPSPALGSRELLWLERALLLFYGFLLLFVPVLRALEGILPIELSTRGARYAEASDAALEELKARIDETDELLDDTIESIEQIARRLPDEAA